MKHAVDVEEDHLARHAAQAWALATGARPTAQRAPPRSTSASVRAGSFGRRRSSCGAVPHAETSPIFHYRVEYKFSHSLHTRYRGPCRYSTVQRTVDVLWTIQYKLLGASNWYQAILVVLIPFSGIGSSSSISWKILAM